MPTLPAAEVPAVRSLWGWCSANAPRRLTRTAGELASAHAGPLPHRDQWRGSPPLDRGRRLSDTRKGIAEAARSGNI